jgi:hypothetical protein
MIHSYNRGHKILFINNQWIYEDTKKPIDNNRPCKKCGKKPIKEGYDACMGYIDGAKSSCCGHGIEKEYIIMKNIDIEKPIQQLKILLEKAKKYDQIIEIDNANMGHVERSICISRIIRGEKIKLKKSQKNIKNS